MNVREALEKIYIITGIKLTQTEFASALNKTRSDINSKIKRGSELKLSEILRINGYFLEKYNLEIDLLKDVSQNKAASDKNFMDIPVENKDFSPFTFGVSEETNVYKISKELARDIKIENCRTKMIFASGDSMHPTIEDGDSVLLNLDNNAIYDGKIYCIKLNGKYLIKRLQYIPDNKIKVISDNREKYDSFYISDNKDDFSIIGQVCWWGRVAK